MSTEQQNREAFAAFVKKNLGDVAVMDNGRYISPKINNYWILWEESRQRHSAQPAPVQGLVAWNRAELDLIDGLIHDQACAATSWNGESNQELAGRQQSLHSDRLKILTKIKDTASMRTAAPSDVELMGCWIEKPDGTIDGIASMRLALSKYGTPAAQPAPLQEAVQPVGVTTGCASYEGFFTVVFRSRQPIPDGTELYTTPPTQPAPVQELSRLEPFVHGLGKAILRELMTCTAPPAAPVQEPVAAQCKIDHENWTWGEIAKHKFVQPGPQNLPGYQTRLLYTKPPAGQPAAQLPDGVIEVRSVGHHSLQLIFDSQESISNFMSAHGISATPAAQPSQAEVTVPDDMSHAGEIKIKIAPDGDIHITASGKDTWTGNDATVVIELTASGGREGAKWHSIFRAVIDAATNRDKI